MAAIPAATQSLADVIRQLPPGYALTVTMSGAGTVATYTPTIDHGAKTVTLALST